MNVFRETPSRCLYLPSGTYMRVALLRVERHIASFPNVPQSVF